MGIKRYYATKDNTISNAYKMDLATRGTGSNMGAADILEVFGIYGQESSSSVEQSRIIVEFPVSTISSDRTAGTVPATGSVSFYLRMFNAKHTQTVPESMDLSIQAISAEWDEGHGLDMEEYRHEDSSNWMSRKDGTAWTTVGGDYHATPSYTASLSNGIDELELDITTLVEQWIAGSKSNYGLGVKLVKYQEPKYINATGGTLVQNLDGATKSFFTKKFFARTSQYFFKRPIIEARWDSSRKDRRGVFNYSSSLAPSEDNVNTLYLYNYVRGQLKNIPGNKSEGTGATGSVFVNIYSGSTAPSGDPLFLSPSGSVINSTALRVVTGGYVATGIYSASVVLTSALSPYTTLYDVWFGGATEYFTGTIFPEVHRASDGSNTRRYASKLTNLKSSYEKDENPKFRLFVRNKNWNPNVYTKVQEAAKTEIIDDAYFKVVRIYDNMDVIPYGTGSNVHTRLSYDVSGSYFDLDMSMLEPDDMYAIKLVYKIDGNYREQPEIFKFRVEK
jgi:hypothetical protein